MALMSNAMHAQGILRPRGGPQSRVIRLTHPTMFGGFEELTIQTEDGGTLLFVSTVLFIGNPCSRWNPKVSGSWFAAGAVRSRTTRRRCLTTSGCGNWNRAYCPSCLRKPCARSSTAAGLPGPRTRKPRPTRLQTRG